MSANRFTFLELVTRKMSGCGMPKFVSRSCSCGITQEKFPPGQPPGARTAYLVTPRVRAWPTLSPPGARMAYLVTPGCAHGLPGA